MTKAILKKSGHSRHGKFVSPSTDRDHADVLQMRRTPKKTKEATPHLTWKKAGMALAGALLLKRFPKTMVMGAFTIGVIVGVAMIQKGSAIAKGRKLEAVP